MVYVICVGMSNLHLCSASIYHQIMVGYQHLILDVRFRHRKIERSYLSVKLHASCSALLFNEEENREASILL